MVPKKGDLVRLPGVPRTATTVPTIPTDTVVDQPSQSASLPPYRLSPLALLPSSLSSSSSLLWWGAAVEEALDNDSMMVPSGTYGVLLDDNRWVYHSGLPSGDIVFAPLKPVDLQRLEVVRPVDRDEDVMLIMERVQRALSPVVVLEEEPVTVLPSSVGNFTSIRQAFSWTSIRGTHIKRQFLGGAATHHGIGE